MKKNSGKMYMKNCSLLKQGLNENLFSNDKGG